MGLKKNKKGLESKIVVILIITVLILAFLAAFSGYAFKGINKIIDLIFGY